MSLLRPIIRMCAVGALRDRTWAEERVYDSDQTPLAEAVLGKAAAPYIVVYTDSDDRMPRAAMEIYNGGPERQLQLAIEIGVASAIRREDGSIVIRFSATDEGMELAVDVVEMQALAALVGDPRSPWGELFKQCCGKIVKMPSRRGGSGRGGVRFAARRTVLVLNTMNDISPGQPLGEEHWARRFIALARSRPQLGILDAASIMESVINNRQPLELWEQAQSWLGVGRPSILNLMTDAPLDVSDVSHPVEDIIIGDDRWEDKIKPENIRTGSPVIDQPEMTHNITPFP